jgi:serine/threonine protein kinase
MDSLQADLALALGPGYRIIRELGGAGMSRVFVAEEIHLEREVVVKVLPEQFSAAAKVDRFRREINLAARLQHPHIVPVLTAGSSGDIVYYTMPFIKGESLRSMIAKQGKISPRVTIGILRDVADALCYAHEGGVVHRDVKPDNIMLQSDNAVVLDFGVAKAVSEAVAGEGLTSTGLALGTPLYMSPEQAAADPNLDERADIYSLGAVGYEMLTGRPPFVRMSPQALMAAHISVKPDAVSDHERDVPSALNAAVMKCLEKNPDDRWASARELRDELDPLRSTPARAASSVGKSSVSTRAFEADRHPQRGVFNAMRRPAARVWYGVAALAVLGAVAASWYYAGRAGPAAPESVAVLPFTNTSGRSENDYLSDGISEELINELGKVEGLRLAARTSSFAFKGSIVDIRDVGRRLGVRNVVEGSVRRSGDSLRVTAQLINVDNGYQAWSHAYDGNVRELFAVQKNIAQS